MENGAAAQGWIWLTQMRHITFGQIDVIITPDTVTEQKRWLTTELFQKACVEIDIDSYQLCGKQ